MCSIRFLSDHGPGVLKPIVKEWSLCLLQVYAPNAVNEYQAFMDDVNDAHQRVGSTESTTFSGDFSAHIGTDCETCKGVIGRHGDTVFNEKGQNLLQLCCSNCITEMSTSTHGTDLVWRRSL